MTTPPPVQYVKTSDAVTIAFTTAGSGPPLVWVQPPFSSHVQLDWEQPILRGGFERIVAAGMTLVHFDPRGSLSDRDVADMSILQSRVGVSRREYLVLPLLEPAVLRDSEGIVARSDGPLELVKCELAPERN